MYHSYEFNIKTDSPDIELLDYNYSIAKPSKEDYAGTGGNGISTQIGITGPFPVGKSVYMKWRVKSTGNIFEDKVELNNPIVGGIKNKRLYCVIDGKQLYLLIMDLEKFREKVTSEELKTSRNNAKTPLQKALHMNILYHVKQIYPGPIVQLQ